MSPYFTLDRWGKKVQNKGDDTITSTKHDVGTPRNAGGGRRDGAGDDGDGAGGDGAV